MHGTPSPMHGTPSPMHCAINGTPSPMHGTPSPMHGTPSPMHCAINGTPVLCIVLLIKSHSLYTNLTNVIQYPHNVSL